MIFRHHTDAHMSRYLDDDDLSIVNEIEFRQINWQPGVINSYSEFRTE
jgi:hypothetical protein